MSCHYYVVSGNCEAQVLEVEDGVTLGTNNTVTEVDSYEEGLIKAFKLGHRSTLRRFSVYDTYVPGEYVFFRNRLFKANRDIDVYEPDPENDSEEATFALHASIPEFEPNSWTILE